MLKKITIIGLLAISFLSSSVSADVFVNGYTKSNGTYVQSHYRTNPDGIKSNNYSYKGF